MLFTEYNRPLRDKLMGRTVPLEISFIEILGFHFGTELATDIGYDIP